MYGLVNQAIEDMITHQFSVAKWEEIKKTACLGDMAGFENMQSYPDNLTYDLIGAVSKTLDIATEQVLEAFGEYWVLYTAEKGYGDMLKMAGDSLPVFMNNLDTLHSIVGSMMPNLRPPSFQCTEITNHSLKLHYHSKRIGLTNMVIGLIKGLGKRFGTVCEVNLIESKKSEQGQEDVFFVQW
jgi:hypothetical protein